MSWLRVDDAFARHRKVLQIPRARRKTAIGLWTLAGTWVAQNLTDGALPAYMLDEFDATDEEVSDLLTVNLWERDGDDYLIHDYLDYNPSREQVLAEREAAKERQRRAREKSAAKRAADSAAADPSPRSPEVRPKSRRDSAVTHGGTSGEVTAASRSPRPDPTRPIPVVPTELPEGQETPSPGDDEPLPLDGLLVTPGGATDRPPRRSPDEEFDAFWDAYPRKVGKQDARRVWDQQRRKTSPDAIRDGAVRYRDDPNREDQFTAHPTTWLRRGGWDDDPLPAKAAPAVRSTTDERVAQAASLMSWASDLDAQDEAAALDSTDHRLAIGGPA